MDEFEHNWVTECGNCTLERKFDALIHIVKRDVEQMNELPRQTRRDYTFETETNTDGPTKPILAVKRYLPHSAPQIICQFMRDRHSIIVSPLSRDEFHVLVQWSEQDGECHLYIRDLQTPFALWEISKRALAPEFFGWERVA